MSRNLSIVLEDRKVLSELCGANDSNLRIIEDLLETPIFSRGNELYLETNDAAKRRQFKLLIDGLKHQVGEGRVPGPDHIKILFESISNEKKEEAALLRTSHIILPNGLKVFPRSYRQALYVDGMEKNDITFSIGPAGTGKTYLAVAHALREILAHKKKKLVLTRPVVEAGENLGFLPGDLTQKVSPYLRPLYDAMDALASPEAIARLEESRIIEIAPLAYMRGRGLRDSLIILDEAQNTTKEQMKMFLTRLGEGSKAIITGDITQIDLQKKKDSGLVHAIDILRSIPEIFFTFFDVSDVVRHPLVRKIVHAYEAEQNQ